MGRKKIRISSFLLLAALALLLSASDRSFAQAGNDATVTDYRVGPQDVLTITSYDQADLSGKFTVEADGTFTYPLIGRVKAGGLTLRGLEDSLKTRLRDEGYFRNPQVTVAVETYKSQKIYVIGEVRSPGPVPLSGDMSLVEAIARAGSTLPTASGEAIIVHSPDATGPTLPSENAANTERVDLLALQNGTKQNIVLRDGDTISVPKAQTVYVTGAVKNPNAYALQQKNTTVLQALSLAGGVTDRGSMSRVKIFRIVKGDKKEIKAKLTDIVQPNDTIVVNDRLF
jgi:polysaccharide export outer membrane protein